ncbi:putative WRKY transcription factor 59 [Hibiscus syriacus]|uniref:WRKY transcription factor 59 n=1 Tax=Hibiscus syriacus TaxID=106335 RepID=A0A6A2X4D6_HIBSY|nr:putative WRKY transcription factor 59 [Hibiscus syriacus]
MDFSHQNPNYTFFPENLNPMPDFQLSDYLMLDDGILDDHDAKYKNGVGKNKSELGVRVALRMKSEMDVIDDGYKWRKYGKKSIKNSPNPRNYYKCSSGGCNVKKRIERDINEKSYVITTYDGVHNHDTPSLLYYNQMPLMAPNAWTLQPSSSSTT